MTEMSLKTQEKNTATFSCKETTPSYTVIYTLLICHQEIYMILQKLPRIHTATVIEPI